MWRRLNVKMGKQTFHLIIKTEKSDEQVKEYIDGGIIHRSQCRVPYVIQIMERLEANGIRTKEVVHEVA